MYINNNVILKSSQMKTFLNSYFKEIKELQCQKHRPYQTNNLKDTFKVGNFEHIGTSFTCS